MMGTWIEERKGEKKGKSRKEMDSMERGEKMKRGKEPSISTRFILIHSFSSFFGKSSLVGPLFFSTLFQPFNLISFPSSSFSLLLRSIHFIFDFSPVFVFLQTVEQNNEREKRMSMKQGGNITSHTQSKWVNMIWDSSQKYSKWLLWVHHTWWCLQGEKYHRERLRSETTRWITFYGSKTRSQKCSQSKLFSCLQVWNDFSTIWFLVTRRCKMHHTYSSGGTHSKICQRGNEKKRERIKYYESEKSGWETRTRGKKMIR